MTFYGRKVLQACSSLAFSTSPFLRVEFVFTISIVCHSSPTKILKWRSSDIILRPEVRSKLIQQSSSKMGVSQKLAPCLNPTNLSSHQNLQIFTTSNSKNPTKKPTGFFGWGRKFPQQSRLSRHLWAFLLERPWLGGCPRLPWVEGLTSTWGLGMITR